MNPDATCPVAAAFELTFRSLFNSGRGYTFPCDAHGHVELDALSERQRDSYLFARAMVGRDLSIPEVHPCLVVHPQCEFG